MSEDEYNEGIIGLVADSRFARIADLHGGDEFFDISILLRPLNVVEADTEPLEPAGAHISECISWPALAVCVRLRGGAFSINRVAYG